MLHDDHDKKIEIQTSTTHHEDDHDNDHNIKINDRVSTSLVPNCIGTVRYIGSTKFAEGCWVGLEMDEEKGKNDGCVGDERYFDCKRLHGIFVPLESIEEFCDRKKRKKHKEKKKKYKKRKRNI